MLFMSKAKRQRVIVKPAFHVLDANGQRVQIAGRTVEFMNGRHEEHDPETIALLLKHSDFNNLFVTVEDEREWMEQHPEYFKSPVQMITGAIATVNSAPMVEATRQPLQPPKPDRFIIDGEIINIGHFNFKVLHTPGHSPGGVCFLFDKIFDKYYGYLDDEYMILFIGRLVGVKGVDKLIMAMPHILQKYPRPS
jgi:glycosyltransferase involved in cell wall biosynthesis